MTKSGRTVQEGGVMSCTDMKALELVFETLFEETAPFPVNPLKFHSAKPIKALH